MQLAPGHHHHIEVNQQANMWLIHWRQNDLNNHEAAARGDDLADVIEDLARALVIPIMQDKLKQIEVAACWHGLEEVAANEFQPGLMALDPLDRLPQRHHPIGDFASEFDIL